MVSGGIGVGDGVGAGVGDRDGPGVGVGDPEHADRSTAATPMIQRRGNLSRRILTILRCVSVPVGA
jgi:hypothetical protein